MSRMFARRSTCAYVIAATIIGGVLGTFTSASRAETTEFKAELSGSNQVPPRQTSASGTVTATYDAATKRLSWKGSYSGLSGPPTAAHIHGPAAAGTNARLVFWISDNVGQCSQGECRSNIDAEARLLTNPFEGSATLTEAQAAELMAGLYYVNIHTNAYPGGELRGQLVKSQSSR